MHIYAISMIYQGIPDKKQIHIWQIYLKKDIFLSKGKSWQALHQGQNQKFRKITIKQHMKMHFYVLSMINQEVLDKNQILIWQIPVKKHIKMHIYVMSMIYQ